MLSSKRKRRVIIAIIILAVLAAVAFLATARWRADFALDMTIHRNNDKGDFQANVDLLSREIEIRPNEASLYVRRASAWYYMDEFQSAMDDIAASIDLAPPEASLDEDGILTTIYMQIDESAYRDMIAGYSAQVQDAMRQNARPTSTPEPSPSPTVE